MATGCLFQPMAETRSQSESSAYRPYSLPARRWVAPPDGDVEILAETRGLAGRFKGRGSI
jgi:hypothetical protein